MSKMTPIPLAQLRGQLWPGQPCPAGAFNSFPAFYGDLSSGMLYWGTEGSNLMVYTPGILPVVSNDQGNAFV